MNNKKYIYLAGLLVLASLISIIVFVNKPVSPKDDSWQAIFLSNNQVYFGKLSFPDRKYAKLENVFYLQSSQSINEKQGDGSDLNLIKLGAEIHGPEDEMYISRGNIMFWENLKSESKIVKIINSYK